jgi:hypothetical protein
MEADTRAGHHLLTARIFVDFAPIGITVPYMASFMRVVPGASFVLETVTHTAEQVKDNRMSSGSG